MLGFLCSSGEIKMHTQRFRQVVSKRFDTYDSAKSYFDTLAVDRKRIRLRANGSFEVLSFRKLKTPKVVDPKTPQKKSWEV